MDSKFLYAYLRRAMSDFRVAVTQARAQPGDGYDCNSPATNRRVAIVDLCRRKETAVEAIPRSRNGRRVTNIINFDIKFARSRFFREGTVPY
jgi:hypothetical protein